MGLNLPGIGKKIEDVLGTGVSDAGHVLGGAVNDVGGAIHAAAPVVNNVVNPVAPVPTAARNFVMNNVVNPVVGLGEDYGKSLVAQATGNQVAFNNANQAMNKTGASFVRGIPRGAVQLAASVPGLTPHVSDNIYHPDNPIARFTLGSEDIPSLQNVYKTTPGGVANKVVTTAGTGAMDVAGVLGGVKALTKGGEALAGTDAGQRLINDETGSVKLPGKAEKPSVAQSGETLNHFTTPESAKALQNGGKFDYSKDPMHGTGGKDLTQTQSGRFVDDGGPALYLSREDNVWKSATKMNGQGETVNLDSITPQQIKEGYLQKNGITPSYDYTQNKYVGIKNGTTTTDLTPVPYSIDSSARQLTIDSQAKLSGVAKELGVHPDDPQFWAKLRSKYDVVNLTNVARNKGDGALGDFFKAAKGDQAIVLNPEKAALNSAPPKLSVENIPTAKPTVRLKTIDPEELDAERQANIPAGTTETDKIIAKTLKELGITDKEIADGKSMGMNPEQVAEAKAGANPTIIENNRKATPLVTDGASPNELDAFDRYKARLATAKDNPLYGQIDVPKVAEGDTTRALQNPSTARRMVVDPANEVMRQGSKLSEADKQLLDLVKTTPRETILSQAENPAQVGRTLDALQHYNDTTHALGTGLGEKSGYKENYGARQFFDIPKEEITQTHAASGSPYTLERKYADYAQGQDQAGLTRLHSNILQDVAHDASIRAGNLGRRALQQGLEQAHPGEVIDTTQSATPRGWKQLRIPDGENLAASPELADQINKRATPNESGVIGQKYDSATRAGKTLAVGGNPFHGITEAFRFVGQQLLSPDALSHPLETLKGHAKVFAGTFSKAAAEEASAGYEADGTRQWSRIGGQTLDRRAIAGDASMKWYDTANKANPIRAIHDAVFGREIPLQKQEIMRQAMQGSTDYSNPEMIAKARQVALATNHMFGGLDHSTDGFSPTTAKWLSRISFSEDYTEAKGRLLQDALTRTDKQGNIARQAVIGKALVAATPGVIALSAAGKINWNDPKDVAEKIAGQIIDPSLPTPFKTASGIAKVALSPNSDISEIARVIEPFFNGDPNKLSGVEHWAVGRVNPVVSPVVKLITNQDYKGDPIWKHNVDAQGNDLGVDYLGTAKNLATGSLTSIGTNLVKAAEGKQSLAEAGVNMAGFRTAADQNDPRMKALNFQTNLIKSQPKQIQDDYSSTHPKRTDANGVVVQDRTFLDSASKAGDFLDNPKLLALDQQIADKNKALGLPTDPFYSLNPTQQKVVLNLTNDRGFNAGDPVIKRQTDDNPWLAKFYADRSSYYNSQNIKPDTVNPTDIPAPIADKPTQALLTQMDNLDGAGRAKLIQNNPSLSDFLAKNEQYTRDKRAALGKPQYDQYPVASPGVQKTLDAYNLLSKSTGERSAWIRNHPQEYADMSAYLSKTSLYNLEQSAGQAAFEGQSLDQKGLKAVSNIGQYDIVKNPDGTLALKYGDIGGGALPQTGAVSTGNVGSSGSSSQSSFQKRTLRNAGKVLRYKAPRVYMPKKKINLYSAKVRPAKVSVPKYAIPSKPKVSLKIKH